MRVARLLLATWCTIRAKKQRPRDACEAALGVLAWRNPGIMDDWLGRSGYCPSVTHGVSVAARVDEAAPEAADDWAPCATPPRTVAVVVREPAGNGVFGFLNAFALAVVTNRTLVARFASPPDFAGNSEAACGAALRLRRWVARDDGAANWSTVPGWPAKQTAEAHILATPGLDELPATFVDFGVMYGHNAAAAAMPEARGAWGRRAAAALFRGGLDLAYGVLFHAAFELARPVPVDADAGFSVALHSRQRIDGDAVARGSVPRARHAAGCAVVRVAHFDGLLASVDRYDGKYGRFSGEVPFSAADWAAALALDGDGSRLDAWARLARGVARCDADARGAFDVVVFGGSVTGGRSCWNPTFPFDEGANCSAWHRFEAWLRWRYPRCQGSASSASGLDDDGLARRQLGGVPTPSRAQPWSSSTSASTTTATARSRRARDAAESLARLVLSEGAVLVVFVAMRADVDDGYQAGSSRRTRATRLPRRRHRTRRRGGPREGARRPAPLPPRNFTARLGAAVAACGGRYLSDFAAADLAAAGRLAPRRQRVQVGRRGRRGAAGRVPRRGRAGSLEVRLGPRPALLVTALASYETFADGVFWLDDDVAAAEAALAATEALEDFCAPKPCGPREACAEKLPECAAFAAGLSPAPHVVRGAWRDRSTMPRTSVFFERAELAPPTRRVPVRTFVLRPGSRFAAPGTHALHVVPRPPRSPASPPAKFRLLRVRSC
ncbi:hypothetical protein JL721_7780 [Aureococcus anophagefferens]|nr:hypothetical protein JL721_7780 [Aureococcus anophagefferens]